MVLEIARPFGDGVRGAINLRDDEEIVFDLAAQIGDRARALKHAQLEIARAFFRRREPRAGDTAARGAILQRAGPDQRMTGGEFSGVNVGGCEQRPIGRDDARFGEEFVRARGRRFSSNACGVAVGEIGQRDAFPAAHRWITPQRRCWVAVLTCDLGSIARAVASESELLASDPVAQPAHRLFPTGRCPASGRCTYAVQSYAKCYEAYGGFYRKLTKTPRLTT